MPRVETLKEVRKYVRDSRNRVMVEYQKDLDELDAQIVAELVEAGEAYWAVWPTSDGSGTHRKAFEERLDAVDFLVVEVDWDRWLSAFIEHPDGTITNAVWDES